MKLEFNPKLMGSPKNTIYLLDEPGSYLHASAQEKLCKKLKKISETHGKVLYCTHSHHLLNPHIIPLNDIYIVEKNNKKNIECILLPNKKSKGVLTTASQTVHEALQSSAFLYSNQDAPVVAVEGIYDKYVISLFINFDETFNILPGTSANSIIKNIQYLNGFEKRYVAIWDNDVEGRTQYDIACKFFGEIESKKFDKLHLGKNGGNRKMEQMFGKDDLNKLGLTLEFSPPFVYEKIISTLYFKDSKTRERIVNSVSEETKQNFEILKKIVLKRFAIAKEIEDQRL